MDAAFRAQSYGFDTLSVPFAIAGAAVLTVAVYVAFMRGAPLLRAAFLLLCAGLLPFVAGYAVVGSTIDPRAAEAIYRLSIALIPLSASGVLLFMIALTRSVHRHRLLIAVSLASSLVLAVLSVLPGICIDGVWRTPSGLWYFTVPRNGLAQLHPLLTGVWVAAAMAIAYRALDRERSQRRRRQFKGAMLAFSTCAIGLVDVALAYRIGWYPVSWAFLSLGALMALRSLVGDDLIAASSVDRRAVFGLGYLVLSGILVWLLVVALGNAAPGAVAAGAVAVFLLLRLPLLGLRLLGEPGKRGDTPLERAINRYAARVQTMRSESEIAEATVDLLELGIGPESATLLIPSEDDYSWMHAGGELLDEQATPDPLISSWFAEHPRPILRDEIETLRLGDLRGSLERLFESQRAELLLPLVSRDEVVGLIATGGLRGSRALRGAELAFLESLAEHAASALVYARMQRAATARVEVDKEVELAAAVQRAFVPGREEIECGRLTLCGVYAPASQCGGDWWSAHDPAGGRALVMIGDVTGHGIAAAMVTAAAKGCYDVAQRLMGDDLDVQRLLELLGASVRRAGRGSFNMTCFASLVDPAAGRITYANAGHPVPYLCRARGSGGNQLDVLVARGNPLGAHEHSTYRAHTHAIEPGDVLVWYTDGVVECSNPRRELFGDRRLQRLLRKIELEGSGVREIRDGVVREAVAFQEGYPADDDITLVVARIH